MTGLLFTAAVENAAKTYEDYIKSKGGLEKAIHSIRCDRRQFADDKRLRPIMNTLLASLCAGRPAKKMFMVAHTGAQMAVFINENTFDPGNLPRAIDAGYLLRGIKGSVVYFLPGWRDRVRDADELYHTAMALECQMMFLNDAMVEGHEPLPEVT